MKKLLTSIFLCFSLLLAIAQNPIEKVSLSSLKFREIGPALTSGRIADIAVNPNNISEYYVATAAGGVWKTKNHGVSFKPIFDAQASFSTGCISMDPNNSNVIWVGSGENNNQRSASYGDGLYKSIDGGKTWENVGLKNSEHIGMICINPDNSDEVYVAAYGPLWSSGGDRGIYKTIDGGVTWIAILEVSENTGFNEIHMDPRDSRVLYATAHQRRRHVWTYLSGGPESAIYKSTDGGLSWRKLESGLPSGDKGRIGMAISPVNPDIVYVMVEGHGFYRSKNRGASFSKMSNENTSGNYYVELVAHPTDMNTVYSMDTYMGISKDGGKTWERVPEKNKHVDNHCLWINPNDPSQMIAGCDGGLYETFDNASTWHYKPNLPITQFYKVALDNDEPFYNVYGGTQDNFSLGGPSQTPNSSGIVNSDWFVTNTGDGFESAIDPMDPNIIYAQYQYGGLVRYDKQSGESVGIKPSPGLNEPAYRYNWDAPLLISPHNYKRVYFAANKVFKSDDRGNNWDVISDDLSQQIDRHTIPIMGKTWGMDAIAYDKSTSNYGNITALEESPLQEGLLYAGTDDGLIQVLQEDGEWKKYSSFNGVPQNTYVNMIKADLFDASTVYAIFNNHKNGDFKPYLLKSTNEGKSWTLITTGLPERGSIYCMAQDPVKKDILFIGTEFGVHVSVDGGANWKKIEGGLPTIAVRDMEIQKRENDLVIATFGRGFWVLDDYSILRDLNKENIDKKALIYPISDAYIYLEASPMGYGGVGFQGASFYSAKNPKMGAKIYYQIKEVEKSIKAKRKSAEAEKEKAGESIEYPTAEDIRAEKMEENSYYIFRIYDSNSKEVYRKSKSASAGLTHFTWNGRISSATYTSINGEPITNAGAANFALPGAYTVKMFMSKDGNISDLGLSQGFNLNWLDRNGMAADKNEVFAFQSKIESSRRKLIAVNNYKNNLFDKIQKLKANTRNTPGTDLFLLDTLRSLEYELAEIEILLNGDNSLSEEFFDTPPSLMDRMNNTVWNSYYSTMEPTGEQLKNISIIDGAMAELIVKLKEINKTADSVYAEILKSGAPFLKNTLPELN